MISQSVTYDGSTDAECIRDSLQTPASFARVFERHFGSVHRYIHRRLGPDLAEELGAETFLIAFDNRSRYDLDRLDARPWLLGIATNLVRHQRRAERRWLKACERVAGELQDHEPATPASLPSEALPEELARSIRGLSSKDREPLLLFAWAELSYEEIAAALDIPAGTVRSRINRARKQIRQALGLPAERVAAPGLSLGRVARDKGDYRE